MVYFFQSSWRFKILFWVFSKRYRLQLGLTSSSGAKNRAGGNYFSCPRPRDRLERLNRRFFLRLRIKVLSFRKSTPPEWETAGGRRGRRGTHLFMGHTSLWDTPFYGTHLFYGTRRFMGHAFLFDTPVYGDTPFYMDFARLI